MLLGSVQGEIAEEDAVLCRRSSGDVDRAWAGGSQGSTQGRRLEESQSSCFNGMSIGWGDLAWVVERIGATPFTCVSGRVGGGVSCGRELVAE